MIPDHNEVRRLVAAAALGELQRQLKIAETRLQKASANNMATTSKTRGRKTTAVARHRAACEAVDRLSAAIALAGEMLE